MKIKKKENIIFFFHILKIKIVSLMYFPLCSFPEMNIRTIIIIVNRMNE